MYKTACPACGAPVEFKSAGSVMAVCSYCCSTLLRDADAVRNIGKMSEVVEDHTRIQINTSGVFEGRNFTVIGRIQLRYADGFWNEWHVLFDDGQSAWLADGSGQYVLTEAAGTLESAPPFDRLRPGSLIPWNGQRYTATDVRTARCVAGEGELPFSVAEGWEAHVADCRCDDRFLTLDYSHGAVPQLFTGVATSLEDLKAQHLREADQVEESAGKLAGSVGTLECPGCGSGIPYEPGKAEHLICPACHAEVSASANQAEVLRTHDSLKSIKTSLGLGDKAKIDGQEWRLIGLMRCREYDSGEDSTWQEYLLFNAKQGFLWLVESDQGWTRTRVLNKLPKENNSSVRYDGRNYTSKWAYGSEVIYAAGAFNWRVSIGDRTWIKDFYGPDGILSQERTSEEITWSLSKKITAQQVNEWFGKTVIDLSAARSANAGAGLSLGPLAKIATGATALFNFNHLSDGIGSLIILGLAILLLWIPVWASGSPALDDGDDE